MDLRQIRYFVAACEEGSFSAAANRLNCTPSGISQQMSALEARLGTRLFERTRRGVIPTSAGRRFYEKCLVVLKAVSEAEIEIEDFKAGLTGTISAGFAPGVAKSLLPQALVRFTREFPQVDIEIASGTADTLVAETFSGALDFYVGQFVKPHVGLASEHIGKYPISLLTGSRRGFTQMNPIRLDTVPLKLFVPSAANSLRPQIEDAIQCGELIIERSMLIDSLSAGLEFVSQTDWSGIMPFWIGLKELGNDRITVSPVIDSPFNVDLALIYPAQRPLARPSRVFYEYFCQELARSEEEWRRLVTPALSNA